MSERYFNINYEFDRDTVHREINRHVSDSIPGYICVADGVILDTANRQPEYLDAVNGSIFSICDSSYVPLYIRLLYGKRVSQYCGSEIFRDIVSNGRYRMIFLGTQQPVLDALQRNIAAWNSDVASMTFRELPFCDIDDFDYPQIARMIADDGAEIIWIALGAPKQEFFMQRLLPHLHSGVMIAVGAAFKFFSGVDERRAPAWMVRNHLEFVYRIAQDPAKQLRRCAGIVTSLPRLLLAEYRRTHL